MLTVNNERFSVAELLFNPTDIGIQQGGLADATAQAIQAMPVDMQGPAYQNIVRTIDYMRALVAFVQLRIACAATSTQVLTGGNAKLPGFEERLLAELRPLVPTEYANELRVTTLSDPETAVNPHICRCFGTSL